MDIYLVRAGELVFLLGKAGVSAPATMTAVEFALPEGTQPEVPEADAEVKQALVDVLAAPRIVVRVWRQDGGSTPRNVWYYWSGDTAVVLQQTDSGDFELSKISGVDVILEAIEASLALRPCSEAEDFYAVLNRKDFLQVRDLANVWEEVPALEILEADGLDHAAARELFDVAVEPEWRAQINLSGLREEGNIERVVRLAQGANSAWMATPVDDYVTRITVETVQEGELVSLLRTYWEEVSQ